MIATFALLALAGAPLEARLTGAAEVKLGARQVRVADVAMLSGGSDAERARAGRAVIALLPPGGRSAALPRRALADLVRRLTGASVAAPGEGMVTLRLEAPVPVQAAGCWEAAEPIAAGARVTRPALQAAQCSSSDEAGALHFDRGTGVVRAAADIPASTPLGRFLPADADPIPAGAIVTLTSGAGPVRISRPVTALQSGREGRRMFVRDSDGAVLAIPVATGPEAGE